MSNGGDKCNGFIGLAPDSDNTPPSYVTALKNAGKITDAQMTFVYPKQNKWDNSTEPSYITFGGMPDGVVVNNTSYKHPVVKKDK